MYAVIDVETTGLSPKRNKIIEIAIIIFDGQQEIESFHTLVHPERKIPANITRLTGISNEMVRNAPKFWEIAKKIVELTEGTILVAHNVSFDYNFVRQEFSELGYHFEREKICTVKLSRKLIPGRNSYSLGKICKEEGIFLDNQHRAYGDAQATVKLYGHLLQIEAKGHGGDPSYSPVQEKINALPDQTGVYYFFDANGDLLYVGKSNNIKDRVRSHFNDFSNNRRLRLLEQIHDISYEITGSNIIALLLESEEIKKHKPTFNKAQRRDNNLFHVNKYMDSEGYMNLTINRDKDSSSTIHSFDNFREAKHFLEKLTETNELCRKLTGLEGGSGACFDYHIKKCKGACLKKETPESYNNRVEASMNFLSFDEKNFFIIDKGRFLEEKSVIKIEHGKYVGFGYIDSELITENNLQVLNDIIKAHKDNKEVRRLISSHLLNKKHEAIIPF